MTIILPKNVRFVLSTLESAGFEAYIVGGCVRDFLLGISPSDYDICTNAKPEDIITIFKKTVNTGIKHGTVAVITEESPVEVTTFRTDGKYADSRHPETVKFVGNLKDDLSRRDFTINAMCYGENTGLIDFFGGMDDIRTKTLRAVGDADMRFGEDALRILRLFRFCSTLEFIPESKTLKAALKNANKLKYISAERIREELFRTANGNNVSAIMPLFETGALSAFHANGQISRIPMLRQNKKSRFFAFLKLTGKSLLKSLDFLKCSKDFKNYCLKLESAMCLKTDTRVQIKKLLRLLESDIFDLLDYKEIINGEDISSARIAAKEIIEMREPYKISQLAVNGNDIAIKGYHDEQIGETLERILEIIIQTPELNTKEKILGFI